MTLNELIISCIKQERPAQEMLYKRFSTVLFAICLRYSPNYEEAQDNLQDAFITIFKKIEQYQGKGSFEGWLKRITVNTVLQKYRKQKSLDTLDEARLEDDAVEVDVAESPIALQVLLTFIQHLPDQYRLVFSMYVLDGYAHKEIASLLGISEGTSKSNLARARGILKTKIEAYKAHNNE